LRFTRRLPSLGQAGKRARYLPRVRIDPPQGLRSFIGAFEIRLSRRFSATDRRQLV